MVLRPGDVQSGDDYLMNETRRKASTRTRHPTLFDKWHGIFYICLVAQTRLDIPRPLITQSWTTGGKVKVLRHKADAKQSNTLQTSIGSDTVSSTSVNLTCLVPYIFV